MKLVPFIVDLRPSPGYVTIYINPEEVACVERNHSGSDNHAKIILRNGEERVVQDWPNKVAEKLGSL